VAAVTTVAVHNGFDSPESDHRNDRQQPRQRRASAATAATDTKITNDDSKQENTMVVGRSALPPPELTNQTALITGGTAGIGLAVARLQVREGAAVIVSGRDRERGQKAVNDISGNIRVVQADLADPGSVKSLVLQSGYADIIVNNAASFPAALTVEQDITSFETMFDTNVRGAYFLVADLVPGMLERGRGSIINVTTMAAFKGVPGASGYSASKAAVESLTRTWAAEFRMQGVRVNSVAPGPARTDEVAAEWGETNEALGRALPLGRTAQASEIAQAVLFLASPRSSFVTGSTLHVDGGGTAV